MNSRIFRLLVAAFICFLLWQAARAQAPEHAQNPCAILKGYGHCDLALLSAAEQQALASKLNPTPKRTEQKRRFTWIEFCHCTDALIRKRHGLE